MSQRGFLEATVSSKFKAIFLGASVLLAAAGQASGLKLDFTFNVKSGSDSLYVCNAGVLSDPNGLLAASGIPFNGNEVYLDPASLSPITEAQCKDNPRNCLTIDTRRDNVRNSLTASYVDWDQNGRSGEREKTVRSLDFPATADARATVFGYNNADSWNHRLTGLEVDLASRLRSAQIFVDVCYRGSQVLKGRNDTTGQPQRPFRLSAALTPRNLKSETGLESWIREGVFSRARVLCDLRGVGNQRRGEDSTGQYNTLRRDGDFVNTTAQSGSDLFQTSSGFILPSNGRTSFFSRLVLQAGGTPRIPRFCRVRYSLNEALLVGGSPLRDAVARGEQITLTTEIED